MTTNKCAEAGFSMVEVAISIAIIATVGISMIGMIPIGYKNTQDAADIAVVSRIIQLISSDAQSSDWNEYANRLTLTENQILYFDDQGNQLDTSGGFNHIYTAKIEIANLSETTNAIDLPGDETQTNNRSLDLRKIHIKVTTLPGEQGIQALSNTVAPLNYTEHFVIVSNFNNDSRTTAKS